MTSFDWHRLWVPKWPPWEVALRGTFIYFFAQLLFRMVGRKELSRYGTHDIVLLLIVSISVRQSIVGTDSSLTTAAIALGTIVAWEALLSYAIYRSRRMARIVEGPLRHLIDRGKPDDDQLRRARLSRDELLAQLRRHGHDDLPAVEHAYLERSGRVTFILHNARWNASGDRSPNIPELAD